MREDVLPLEFRELEGKIHYVSQITSNEYSSSCPNCGGSAHRDGSFPDRFRMWIRSTATGEPLGWCRRCGYKWWQDRDDGHKFTEEEKAAFKAERARMDAEKEKAVADTLAEFQKSRVWDAYHSALDDGNNNAREYYLNRMIDDYWIEYWKLGYCYGRKYEMNGNSVVSDSYTIPIVDNGHCVNVKHRIVDDSLYRYSYDRRMLPKPAFVCDHEAPLTADVLIVEGEFKAMTTYIALDDPSMNVVGTGSVTPDTSVLEKYKEAGEIYLILDPDGNSDRGNPSSPLRRITSIFNGRCRVVYLPGKVDDMIVSGLLTGDRLRKILANSLPLVPLT